MQFGDPAIDRLKVITKKERGGGVDHPEFIPYLNNRFYPRGREYWEEGYLFTCFFLRKREYSLVLTQGWDGL